eukprot:scaffold16302_cov136-Isochrysis_galbana.AAC.1
MARCRSCIELQRESNALRPPTPTRGTRTSMSRRAGDGLGRPPPQRAQMLNQQSTINAHPQHYARRAHSTHSVRLAALLFPAGGRLARPLLGRPTQHGTRPY